jgi:hypothetical protein
VLCNRDECRTTRIPFPVDRLRSTLVLRSSARHRHARRRPAQQRQHEARNRQLTHGGFHRRTRRTVLRFRCRHRLSRDAGRASPPPRLQLTTPDQGLNIFQTPPRFTGAHIRQNRIGNTPWRCGSGIGMPRPNGPKRTNLAAGAPGDVHGALFTRESSGHNVAHRVIAACSCQSVLGFPIWESICLPDLASGIFAGPAVARAAKRSDHGQPQTPARLSSGASAWRLYLRLPAPPATPTIHLSLLTALGEVPDTFLASNPNVAAALHCAASAFRRPCKHSLWDFGSGKGPSSPSSRTGVGQEGQEASRGRRIERLTAHSRSTPGARPRQTRTRIRCDVSRASRGGGNGTSSGTSKCGPPCSRTLATATRQRSWGAFRKVPGARWLSTTCLLNPFTVDTSHNSSTLIAGRDKCNFKTTTASSTSSWALGWSQSNLSRPVVCITP